jgi:hypothetical protein
LPCDPQLRVGKLRRIVDNVGGNAGLAPAHMREQNPAIAVIDRVEPLALTPTARS